MIKAIFNGYEYDRVMGEVFFTSTRFELEGDYRLTKAGVLSFLRWHLKCPTVKLEPSSLYASNLNGYGYNYWIIIGNKRVGSINFFSGDKTAFLSYYNTLHDAGYTYGDYEIMKAV